MNHTHRSLAVLGIGLLSITACGGDEGASPAEYCSMISAYEAESETYSAVFDTDNPDPAAVEAAFEAMGAQIDGLEKNAPSEIKAEVSAMADATRQLAAIFEKNDWDAAKIFASDDFAELMELMNSDDISAADERLEQYAEETCGLNAGS